MNVVTAFAAVGLTAVSWDDTLSRAGARAFRHALDYREPYCRMSENEVVLLMDACLLYTSPSPRDPKTSRMPSSA